MATVSPADPTPGPLDPAPDPFEDEVLALVRATAPRLFAVVVEYDTACGERDACVAGWGMTDGESTYVAGNGGRTLGVLRAPESALRLMGRARGGTARLVWPGQLPTAEGLENG